MGETTEDLMKRWWRRLRRPLGALFVLSIVIRNREALTSGELLPTVTALSLVGFLGWLLLRPTGALDLAGKDADGLREHYRREILGWGAWSAVAVAISVWVAVAEGYRPAYLVYLVPLLPLLASVVSHRKADLLAARLAEQRR